MPTARSNSGVSAILESVVMVIYGPFSSAPPDRGASSVTGGFGAAIAFLAGRGTPPRAYDPADSGSAGAVLYASMWAPIRANDSGMEGRPSAEGESTEGGD